VILADTSVWVDHLRVGNIRLGELLDSNEVLIHPFVLGELALGHLQPRQTILDALRLLPQAVVASQEELLDFIDRNKLFGFGIGYVDAHLLAATRLTAGAGLWTRDKRLRRAADHLTLAANLPV
jgi:predicted nucleic acid-binding protein